MTGAALVFIGSAIVQLGLTALVQARRRRVERRLRLHLLRGRLDRHCAPDR